MAVMALLAATIGTKPADPSTSKIPIAADAKGGLPLLAFKLRHREYREEYWARLRALYRGGESLLGNLELLKQIIPKNNAESEDRYQERLRCAFYANYSSEIVGFVMAGLCEDPLRVVVGDDGTAEPAGFLAEFVKDTANNADEPVDLNTLARDVILEALQVRTAWVHLCAPADPDPELLEHMSRAELETHRAEQDERIEARCLPAEAVINWCDDQDGDLVWALTQAVEEIRPNFWDPALQRFTWTLHTRDDSKSWTATIDPKNPPQDETIVAASASAPHQWGRVPLLRFALPHDLWAMDKLESLAREHTDKRNDLARSVKRSANPMLYEFMGAEQPGIGRPISAIQQDANRSTNTPRSPGHVQRRGRDDRAEFVAPPSDAYAQILAICHDVRDDMHRVMVQMALAADFKSASAIGRSGESKAQDKAATAVVLGAIGKRFRPWAVKLLRVVVGAGGDTPDTIKPQVQGMAKFDATVVGEIVEQTQMLEGVTIPSPTAKAEIALRLLRAVLDNLDAQKMAKISKELEDGFNPETVLQQQVDLATQLAVANAAGEPDDPDEGDEDPDEDEVPPPKAKAAGPKVDTAAKPKRRRA